MVAGNDILSEFVSGSEKGRATSFCSLCGQDVSIVGRGIGEINSRIVIENVTLLIASTRVFQFISCVRPSRLLMHSWLITVIDLSRKRWLVICSLRMNCENTAKLHQRCYMVGCLTDAFRGGGSYTMLRCLWDFFRASLSESDSIYHIIWTKRQALVCPCFCFRDFFEQFGHSSKYCSTLLCLYSFICDALYPRVPSSVFGAVRRFKSYSLEFKEQDDGLYCYVRTWNGLRMK